MKSNCRELAESGELMLHSTVVVVAGEVFSVSLPCPAAGSSGVTEDGMKSSAIHWLAGTLMHFDKDEILKDV